jgi:serine-type D-Ala-D-Ala carboxypeptidase (penicillin-binding protein 5/6)
MRAQTRFVGRFSGVVAALLAAAAIAAPAAQAAQAAPATRAAHGLGKVAARSAELANASNGAVLWTRDASAERPMGSITKVITVPKGIIAYDDRYGASTAGLEPGQRYTALQLLYAMLIPSGCDAAYTLASAYGPGLSKFIAKMNATARKLGLTRTHFTDPSGLPDPSETSTYSTARDLVSLGRDAMKLALFRKIVAVYTYHLAAARGLHPAYIWTNYNQLLISYKGAIGIKTGQTNAAGACLLFEARRGAKTLIGVVLDSSSTSLDAAFTDAKTLLNWGFGH